MNGTKNTSNTLDPFVERIARYYDFNIRFDSDLDMWMITADDARTGVTFYWDSAGYTINNFLDTLAEYFRDTGEDRGWGY